MILRMKSIAKLVKSGSELTTGGGRADRSYARPSQGWSSASVEVRPSERPSWKVRPELRRGTPGLHTCLIFYPDKLGQPRRKRRDRRSLPLFLFPYEAAAVEPAGCLAAATATPDPRSSPATERSASSVCPADTQETPDLVTCRASLRQSGSLERDSASEVRESLGPLRTQHRPDLHLVQVPRQSACPPLWVGHLSGTTQTCVN